MSSFYCGAGGSGYTIEDSYIAKGGEGFIFGIKDHGNLVAKIYKEEKRSESLHRKLLIMLQTKLPTDAMEQITWPVDVLYDSEHEFVGYVMSKLQGSKDLNVLYSDDYKNITLSQRIVIAQNLCSAIDAVHETGHVCGDLNPKNIEVDIETARVTLVDTDSYHIKDPKSGRVYRCDVGLPEYIAPELQNKMRNGSNLRTAGLPTYTMDTDNFALAVHIFALLMNGCHPYACAVDTNKQNFFQTNLVQKQVSIVAPQPDENICAGRTLFFKNEKKFKIPIYAPGIDILPINIQNLFRKAFVDGHLNPQERPTPKDWYYALEDYRKCLKQCTKISSHMYYSELGDCPWCKLDQSMMRFRPPTPHVAPPSPPPVAVTPAKPNIVNHTPQPVSSNGTITNTTSSKRFPIISLLLFCFFTYGVITRAIRTVEKVGYVVSPDSDIFIILLFGSIFAFNLYRYVKNKKPRN